MRIAVFGGTFDPPHKAHLALAKAVLERGAAGRVLFVPAADPPHKALSTVSPYATRLAMLKLAIAGEPRFSISEIEAERLPKPSYTVDTMTELSARSPQDRFALLIGSDSLAALHTWMRAGELAANCEFAVYPRKGCAVSLDDLRLHWPEPVARKLHSSLMEGLPESDLSSSWLRSELANSRNAARFIPEAVLGFIQERKLYGTE